MRYRIVACTHSRRLIGVRRDPVWSSRRSSRNAIVLPAATAPESMPDGFDGAARQAPGGRLRAQACDPEGPLSGARQGRPFMTVSTGDRARRARTLVQVTRIAVRGRFPPAVAAGGARAWR